MRRDDLNAWVAIISSGRPKNVLRMRGLVGPATWYVPEGQGKIYEDSCANAAIESGALCRSRNRALFDAFEEGLPCIQLSDDLTRLEKIDDNTEKPSPCSFLEAVSVLEATSAANGAKLAGVAPTTNTFFYNSANKISTSHFIVGDFIYVRPCELRFDEKLNLKEDYDYTLKHLCTFGKVARCNNLFAHFSHRTNAGGAVAFRTVAREQEAIARLREVWGPQCIVDNKKRPNEILLRWNKR